jgi:hypothetical protein
MYIDKAILAHCLDQANALSDQRRIYGIAADDPLRSVDQLTEICKTYLRKKIRILELDIDKDDSPVFGSTILLRDGSYDICHVKNLNYCWQRFVTCKELFHVVLDEVKYRRIAISDHVDEVTVAFPDDNSRPNMSVVAEILAEIAAMEYLFPYKDREMEFANKHGNIDCRAIADRYKVPLVYIEKYLSPPHMTALSIVSSHPET